MIQVIQLKITIKKCLEKVASLVKNNYNNNTFNIEIDSNILHWKNKE
jgi:hypothetical protein